MTEPHWPSLLNNLADSIDDDEDNEERTGAHRDAINDELSQVVTGIGSAAAHQTTTVTVDGLSSAQLRSIAEAGDIERQLLAVQGTSTVTWHEAEGIERPENRLSCHHGTHAYEWLPVGEVMVVSGAGGMGKSQLALEVAVAAATGGTALGIREHAPIWLDPTEGPALFVSYEDRVPILRDRAAAISTRHDHNRDLLNRLHLADDYPPIWQTSDTLIGAKSGPAEGWNRLVVDVARSRPSLIIIDPASVALEGNPISEIAPVRAFMLALRRLGDWAQAAVILVAHSPKSGRTAGAGASSADAIAGSGAWYDAARMVLTLTRPPQDSEQRMILTAAKCQYSAPGPLGDISTGQTKTGQTKTPEKFRGRECWIVPPPHGHHDSAGLTLRKPNRSGMRM